MIKTICNQCSKSFEMFPCRFNKSKLHFCNKSCHRVYKNTIDNPSLHRDLSGKNNPMYGKPNPSLKKWNDEHKGEKNPNWKGGLHTRADGYVRINIKGKRTLLHRHILANQLKDDNVIHHKDRNPSNNSIDNLEILKNQSEHAKLHANHITR